MLSFFSLLLDIFRIFTCYSYYIYYSILQRKDLHKIHHKILNKSRHKRYGNLFRSLLFHKTPVMVIKNTKKGLVATLIPFFFRTIFLLLDYHSYAVNLVFLEDVPFGAPSKTLTLVLRLAISPAVTTTKVVTVIGAAIITTAATTSPATTATCFIILFT